MGVLSGKPLPKPQQKAETGKDKKLSFVTEYHIPRLLFNLIPSRIRKYVPGRVASHGYAFFLAFIVLWIFKLAGC